TNKKKRRLSFLFFFFPPKIRRRSNCEQKLIYSRWHLLNGGVLTLHAAGSWSALVMLSVTPKFWLPWNAWQRQATSFFTTPLSPEQHGASGFATVLPSCT
ncbi:Os03g0192633, partial [Oryza sativa Japonica Group]